MSGSHANGIDATRLDRRVHTMDRFVGRLDVSSPSNASLNTLAKKKLIDNEMSNNTKYILKGEISFQQDIAVVCLFPVEVELIIIITHNTETSISYK